MRYAMAIPSPVRTPVARLAEASSTGTAAEMAPLVSDLGKAAHEFLDGPARAELEALARDLTRPAS